MRISDWSSDVCSSDLTLMRISDVVTIHCPHTSETHEMVNAARIAAMKPTAYLINTARGEIVDEKALIAALKTKRIAGAGLDVYAQAPKVDPERPSLGNETGSEYGRERACQDVEH